MNEDMKLAVKRGAYWLDSVYPEWAQHVDLAELEMNQCFKCVLGQVFSRSKHMSGYYAIQDVAFHAGELGDWNEEHGFNLPGPLASTRKSEWEDLRDLWADQIIERVA